MKVPYLLTTAGALVLYGALLGGCDSGGTPPASLSLSEPLAGTNWTLVKFVEGDEMTDAGATTISLAFSEQNVGGESIYRGDVRNRYDGSYQSTDEGDLDIFNSTGHGNFPGVTSTRVNEPEGSRFDDYVRSLRQVSAYGFDGDTLVLTDGERHLLRFERQ